MKDLDGRILYVGKAKNLRNRVTTYFQGIPHELPRIELLVRGIHQFDVILTETEDEALILECTLIKKHKPKFNIRLKDDKAYPYLKIQTSEAYPRLEWTRRVMRDGARYFGPFPSAFAARQVLQLLNDTFLLRDCSENTFRNRSRPCLLYQIGKCSGPCVGLVDEKAYRERIDQATAVLEGKGERLTEELTRGMEDAAAKEEFEAAAEYRDQLRNIESITAVQSVLEAGSERDRDVVAVARKDAVAHAVVLQIRGGRLIAVRHYDVQNAESVASDPEILTEFLAQHYWAAKLAAESETHKDAETVPGPSSFGAAGPVLAVPNEVLMPEVQENVEDLGLMERTLGVRIRFPENEIDRRLLSVAIQNAKYSLEQNEKRRGGHGVAALDEVQRKLHLSRLPQRIECFDISNIQGEDSVASRVVFIDGAPDKNLYRRYKIRTVEGANDFAMMKEVLGRRFAAAGQSGDELPDLVVVDGGKGQLSQAVAILEELTVQGVAVAGLAKARTESDFQAAEVKSSHERIFLPGRKNPVALLPHTAAYKLLVHVRDEAHRFAVSYHRVLRGKRSLKSDQK